MKHARPHDADLSRRAAERRGPDADRLAADVAAGSRRRVTYRPAPTCLPAPQSYFAGTARVAPGDRRHGSVSQGRAFRYRNPRHGRGADRPRRGGRLLVVVQFANRAGELTERVRPRRAGQQHRPGHRTRLVAVPGRDRTSTVRDQRPERDAGALVGLRGRRGPDDRLHQHLGRHVHSVRLPGRLAGLRPARPARAAPRNS
jgi:hypothetical protein